MKTITTFAFVSLTLLSVSFANADTFGVLNQFDIEFVTIGNPGNAADTTGAPNPAGKVDYNYRIGKYEISEEMINKANVEGGLGITHDNRGANKPATSINWFEAAKFVNYLNTSNGSTAAYKFDGGGNFQLWSPGDAGYNADNQFRNDLAKYFLPSADEWYKAAYYDPTAGVYYDYPTGSDTVPTAVSSGTTADTAVYDQSFATIGPADINQAGGLSPYGTMGQGGNAHEYEETNVGLVNEYPLGFRRLRGGFWYGSTFFLTSSHESTGYYFPSTELNFVGFRVASVVPEPNSALLGVLTTVGLMLRRRRLRQPF